VKYTIRTKWWVPTEDGAWEWVDGTLAGPYFLYDFQVRPEETWDNKGTPYEVDLAHTAPERGVQLDFYRVFGARSTRLWYSTMPVASGK
jgi:hypothetical protein